MPWGSGKEKRGQWGAYDQNALFTYMKLLANKRPSMFFLKLKSSQFHHKAKLPATPHLILSVVGVHLKWNAQSFEER